MRKGVLVAPFFCANKSEVQFNTTKYDLKKKIVKNKNKSK